MSNVNQLISALLKGHRQAAESYRDQWAF